MAAAASAAVHQHFKKLHLNATTEWIEACLQWCLSEEAGFDVADRARLVKACYEQWLNTDIRFPGIQQQQGGDRFPAETALKTLLPAGFYTVQVNAAHDIGLSAYSQLQKVRKVKDENTLVSADTDFRATASWEPKPNRMLKFALTDGTRSLEAIEHQRLSQITDPVQPGLKLTIVGPVVCRRGLLLLTPQNVKVLGGVVDEMQNEFSEVKQLTAKLEIGRQQETEAPTQQYVPRGRPPKFRQSSRGKAVTKSAQRSLTNDVFNDTDDELLASMDMPSAISSTSLDENVFDDEEDELFSQIELGTPVQVKSKRGRFH